VSSYDDLGLCDDPQQMTKKKHREDNSGDTQSEALVSHAFIIGKTS